jgi:hypothetical protein
LLHEAPGEISVNKSDTDPSVRAKLQAFRDKISTGRLVKFWKAADELPGLVALSLSKTIKTYPAVGWVRASHVANEDVLVEINDLRKENTKLRESINALQSKEAKFDSELAAFDDVITVRGNNVWYTHGRHEKAVVCPHHLLMSI